MKLRIKGRTAGVVISIIFLFILGFIGYRVSCGGLFGLEKYGIDWLQSNKLDDFQVGNGASIFLINKLHPSPSDLFLVQTSCNTERPDLLDISSEQAGLIHSTAIQNPSKNVILLYTCPHDEFINLNSPPSGFVGKLMDLPNFRLSCLNRTSELANETAFPFKPCFLYSKNVLLKLPTDEPTKQHNSNMNGYDSGELRFHESDEYGSAFRADEYWTLRKLSPSSDNIYFLETSCPSLQQSKPTYTPLISARQACAIHSTAFYNPSREVILLYTCHGFADKSLGLAKTLFELPNFSMARINLTDFFSNTLDMKMRKSLEKSEFPENQTADILRLFVLYLYGGTYMDLDIISLKPITDLPINFIGAEHYQSVSNGLLSFEAQHKFLKECLKEAVHMYRPSLWDSVGPLLLFRVIMDRSGLEMIPQNWSDWKPFMEVRHLKNCNVTVLPSRYFYAVPYWDWARFYNESALPDVLLELQHSYIAHFWNHMGSLPVYMFGNQPYAKLAKQHCSAVFEYEHKRGGFFLE